MTKDPGPLPDGLAMIKLMSRIIVGIDGSTQATKALLWAIDHARDNDTIVAMHAWQVPAMSGLEAPGYNPAEVEVEANRLVETVITEIITDRADRPSIETAMHHGHAGRSLVDEADDADLIVVGTRGHGTVKGMLLGSVSTYVLRHAHCAVVVVPG